MSCISNIPFFSVIVPVYNVAGYIDECLKSIVQQSFENFEVIVVDDGSTDESSQICDEYAVLDNRVKVIHKPNGGLVSARKVGSMTAIGRYIINIDGDDYIDNNALEEIYDVLKVTSHDIVWYSYNRVNSSGMILTTHHNKAFVCKGSTLFTRILYDENKPFYSHGYDFSLCTKAIKRELYCTYQQLVPDSTVMGEDLALTLPAVASARSVCFIDRPLYNYRTNNNSITAKVRDKDVLGLKILLKHLKSYVDFEDDLMKNQLAAYTISRLFNMFVCRCRHSNSYGEFRQFVKELDTYLIDIARDFKYNLKSVKGLVVPFVIKYKLTWLIWLYYHRK